MQSGGLATATLASMLLACTFPASVRGSVRVPGATPAASSEPVSGAQVTMLCPEREPLVLGETDASGRFEHDVGAPFSNACWIVTEKSGLYSERVRVLDACAYSRRTDQCIEAVVTAHLVPRQAP